MYPHSEKQFKHKPLHWAISTALSTALAMSYSSLASAETCVLSGTASLTSSDVCTGISLTNAGSTITADTSFSLVTNAASITNTNIYGNVGTAALLIASGTSASPITFTNDGTITNATNSGFWNATDGYKSTKAAMVNGYVTINNNGTISETGGNHLSYSSALMYGASTNLGYSPTGSTLNLNNMGTVSGTAFGVTLWHNDANIINGSATNSTASITASSNGGWHGSAIHTYNSSNSNIYLENWGEIIGGLYSTSFNNASGNTATIKNKSTGLMSGFLSNSGTITLLENEGRLTHLNTTTNAAIIANYGGTITEFVNKEGGVIGPTGSATSARYNVGIKNGGGGVISSFSNAGVIGANDFSTTPSYVTLSAIENGYSNISNDNGYIYNISNTGFINGSILNNSYIRASAGENAIFNSGYVKAIYNYKEISSTNGLSSIFNESGGEIANLANYSAGTISGSDGNYGINNNGTIGNINNQGIIGSLNNSSSGVIQTLTNYNSIPSINNSGRIVNHNNYTLVAPQAYTGILPENYLIRIDSTADYSVLNASDISGTMTFDIGSISTGKLTNDHLYEGVVSGVSLANYASGAIPTGTFDTFNWSLVLQDGSTSIWDLCVGSICPVTPIITPPATPPATPTDNNGLVYRAALGKLHKVAYNAASVIDNSSKLTSHFENLNEESISDASLQVLPLLTGASAEGVRSALTSINRVIQSRIVDNNRGMSSGDAEIGTDKYMWIKPFSSWADQDDVLSISGFESHTEGLAIGADGAVSDTTRLGFAVSYANSRIDSNSSIAPQNADINLYQVISYGSKTLTNDTELNFQVDYGMNKNKAARSILFTDSVASSSYDSKVAHAAVGLGKTYAINDNNTFTASIRGDYTVIKDDAYVESGAGDLNLSVDSRTSKEFVVSIDGKYLHAFDKNLSLATKIGVGYDTLNEQASLTAAYAGAPTASFVTDGLRPDPIIGKVGIGLLHQADSGAELTMDYDAEYRDGFLNQTASFKARWMF